MEDYAIFEGDIQSQRWARQSRLEAELLLNCLGNTYPLIDSDLLPDDVREYLAVVEKDVYNRGSTATNVGVIGWHRWASDDALATLLIHVREETPSEYRPNVLPVYVNLARWGTPTVSGNIVAGSDFITKELIYFDTKPWLTNWSRMLKKGGEKAKSGELGFRTVYNVDKSHRAAFVASPMETP